MNKRITINSLELRFLKIINNRPFNNTISINLKSFRFNYIKNLKKAYELPFRRINEELMRRMELRRKKNLKLILNGWSANQTTHAEGCAFIALTPDAARDQISAFQDKSPHILVCPNLDWSWSDIANAVAGIVTDHGTRVSRGSEVSGIVQVPAVLGTKVATQQIIEGDFIEIVCEGTEALAKIYSSR